MLKRINWKGVFVGFCWVLSLSGLVLLMGFIEQKKASVKCRDVRVFMPGASNFIGREEIDLILQSTQGSLVGQDLDRINIHRLEKALKANPFIEFAKVYADMTGVIQVQVEQRVPVLRVLNLANQDFYIDKNGLKMPLSNYFTANVLAANGYILENFTNKVDTIRTPMMKDLFATAAFIEKDTLWNEQIEQIYVNERQEIELVPRVGDHKIILGSADSLQKKFSNLLAFYKKAMPKVGWRTYKTINIKYTNQVVCERRTAQDTILILPKPVSLPDTNQTLTQQ